jgi:CheY-like chemotaxis protein
VKHKILHIEDNPDDILLTELAFQKAGVAAELVVATDGDQAIVRLRDCPDHELPSLVLLDLKLPKVSGLEVLSWIRSQPRTRRLPVVVLTSSTLPADVNQAYDLGANSYLAKPSDSLVPIAAVVEQYWLKNNIAPSVQAP